MEREGQRDNETGESLQIKCYNVSINCIDIMKISLPIADTQNNRAFETFINSLVDGDEFHQRHETENFIFNVLSDKSVMMTEQGYFTRTNQGMLFVTHKPTGMMKKMDFTTDDQVMNFVDLKKRIELSDEKGILSSAVNVAREMVAGGSEISVGDLVSYCARSEIDIPESMVSDIAENLFMMADNATDDVSISEFARGTLEHMPDREKNRISRVKGLKKKASVDTSDFRIAAPLKRLSLEDWLVIDPTRGGEDIAGGMFRKYHPPCFKGTGDDLEEIVASVNENRYERIRVLLDDIRKEALLIAAQRSKASDVDMRSVEEDIETAYPIIQEACEWHQEGWDLFLGKSHQQIRNRAQLLDGPLNKSVKALSSLLDDDDFRAAIDEGRSLKEPMQKLPLFNTSKKSVHVFLNNVSAMDKDPTKGAHIVITEKGQMKASTVRFGPGLELDTDLKKVATLQAIPEKYFNSDALNLRSIYYMPYIDLALPAAIDKVKRKEWGTQQAFQWIDRLSDSEDASRLANQVSDSERILGNMFVNTVSAYLIHQSGLKTEHIENQRYREDTAARNILEAMAVSQPYSAILNLSSELHKRIQALVKIGSPEGYVSWKPAIEEDFKHKDITITPIHNTHEMTQEGTELDHCVASYVPAAMEGETFIFGVRDNEGRRLSTIEIREGEEAPFEIYQHYARTNSAPSKPEQKAAEIFLEKLNNEEIPFNFDTNVSKSDLAKLMPVERLEVEQGIRFSDPEVVIQAVRHLEEMMPGVDIINLIKEDLTKNGELFHDREYIADEAERLDELCRQSKLMSYTNS